MKGAAPKLAAKEWDFSGIPEEALQFVVEWEYMRSSCMGPIIVDWIQKVIRGKTINDHLKNRRHLKQDVGLAIVRDGLKTIGARAIVSRLFGECHDARITAKEMLSKGLKVSKNPCFFAAELHVSDDYLAMLDAHPDKFGVSHLVAVLKGSYFFKPNWSLHTVEEVCADVSRQIRKFAARQKSAQRIRITNPREKLKWLGAYRFAKAGYTFDAAQAELRKLKADTSTAPVYSDKSTWSKAVKNAKAEIATLDSARAFEMRHREW